MDTIFLDFAKAFDKVSHSQLLLKLQQHGIKGQDTGMDFKLFDYQKTKSSH